MKYTIIIVTCFLSSQIAYSQHKVDSAKCLMRNFLDTVYTTAPKGLKSDDLIISFHCKIAFSGEVYKIYSFGSRYDLHEAVDYILFYSNSQKFFFLGRKDLSNDLIRLNQIYEYSKGFKKDAYVKLVNVLIRNYK